MRKMAKIVTWDGDIYMFDVERADRISAEMAKEGATRVRLLEGGFLIFSNIKSFDMVTVPDEAPAIMDVPLIAAPVDLSAVKPRTEYQERWWKLIGLNRKRLAKRKSIDEKVPLLKNLEDLDAYEADGTWPEYVPPHLWKTKRPETVRTGYIWAKRMVTGKEWASDYSKRGNYYKLTESGSDIWAAFKKTVNGTGPYMFEDCYACEPAEIDHLEMMLSEKVSPGSELPEDFYSEESLAKRREENKAKYGPKRFT